MSWCSLGDGDVDGDGIVAPSMPRLLLSFFCTRMGAVLGAVAGCGTMIGISIGGAEGLGVGSSLVWQQHFQRQRPIAKNADG
jgi:hypothetical protein